MPVIWVIDPAEKVVWIYRRNGMERAMGESVQLDGTPVEVPFSEIFD